MKDTYRTVKKIFRWSDRESKKLTPIKIIAYSILLYVGYSMAANYANLPHQETIAFISLFGVLYGLLQVFRDIF